MTNATISRLLCICSVAVLLILGVTDAAISSEQVSIRLNDGMKLTAELHPRTNSEHLWLRFADSGIVILRSIAWQRIDEAKIGEQVVTATMLQQLAKGDGSTVDAPPAPPSPTGNYASQAEQAHALLGFSRRLNAVDFDARLANWDRDVEFDGIVLRLFPLDSNGNLAKVRGTLHAQLVAGRRTDFNDAPSNRGLVPQQLAKWTIAVSPEQVTEDGTIIKLPFQANHPEFDTKWATHGLVHVRFVVPGHGVFEHSFDGVRVRPFAPLRDALERQGAQRFLPTEATSVNKRVE